MLLFVIGSKGVVASVLFDLRDVSLYLRSKRMIGIQRDIGRLKIRTELGNHRFGVRNLSSSKL